MFENNTFSMCYLYQSSQHLKQTDFFFYEGLTLYVKQTPTDMPNTNIKGCHLAYTVITDPVYLKKKTTGK